jgi:hypothetical protein
MLVTANAAENKLECLSLERNFSLICGLHYKCFTIVIIMIVNYASVWSVIYDRNLQS